MASPLRSRQRCLDAHRLPVPAGPHVRPMAGLQFRGPGRVGVYRKKMGGSYRRAPVMIDKIQAVGSGPTAISSWSAGTGGMTVPTANHRAAGLVPAGGNFLYEDGSVSWRKFSIANYRNTIDVGSKSSGWVVFYRPANLTAGPW